MIKKVVVVVVAVRSTFELALQTPGHKLSRGVFLIENEVNDSR